MAEIIDKMDVQQSTKITYKKKYNYVKDTLKIDIEGNEKAIIDKLKTVKETNNTILSYINIVYVIRKALNLPINEIKDYRATYFNKNAIETSETNKKNENNGLPSLKTLKDYTDDLFTAKKYKKYIINYLILNFSTRNKDLDIFITDKAPTDDKRNYLFIQNDKVDYFRNDYKTVKKHDKKKHTITDKNFLVAVKTLTNTNLLKNSGGNFSKEVIEATYNQLGQARYLKITMLETDEKDIHKLGESRGTSGGTLMAFYDMTKGKQLREPKKKAFR